MTRPAWVLSGAPWVTIAFAIVQVKDMMTLVKNSGPSPDSLQVKISCVRCLFQNTTRGQRWSVQGFCQRGKMENLMI